MQVIIGASMQHQDTAKITNYTVAIRVYIKNVVYEDQSAIK